MGASLTQSHAHFSSGCGFMVGLGKPKLCTKFEVASFSHCVNIEGEPQIFGSSSSPWPRPPFLLRVILWWALANPSCVPNLKLLASWFLLYVSKLISKTSIYIARCRVQVWCTLYLQQPDASYQLQTDLHDWRSTALPWDNLQMELEKLPLAQDDNCKRNINSASSYQHITAWQGEGCREWCETQWIGLYIIVKYNLQCTLIRQRACVCVSINSSSSSLLRMCQTHKHTQSHIKHINEIKDLI